MTANLTEALPEDVVRAAERMLRRACESDIALSITGYAGPGGEDQEEGLVHLACARRDRPTIHREAHDGRVGRAGVRVEALRAATETIEEMMD